MGQNEGYGLGKHLVALQLCTSVTYLVCVCVCVFTARIRQNEWNAKSLPLVAPRGTEFTNKPRKNKQINKYINATSKFCFSISCSTAIPYV